VDGKQKKSANAFIAAIEASNAFEKKIATELVPLTHFFPAEEYHQNFLKNNPDDPYIVAHDMPKLAALKEKFPDLYRK
jgi:peptide-methionine (S)-S-oxide reductase